MMEKKGGLAIIKLINGNDIPCTIGINDWWWENNLLVLRSVDGKRRYYNRENIEYLSVPDMTTV